MRVLVAPDKFKGTLSARAVAQAVAAGLADAEHDVRDLDVRLCPIADGGEGTAVVLAEALGASRHTLSVHNPIGARVNADYYIARNHPRISSTALIEMSAASGLALLRDDQRAPWSADTYGTGELLADAARLGVSNIILGIGGSATNDGGVGMARALGVVFRDAQGVEVRHLPAQLSRVQKIDVADRLPLPKIEVACDVINPLLGPEGASAVFGPQKGVQPKDLHRHETRLQHLAHLVCRDLDRDLANVPGTGAAGGLGFGLLSFCGARLTAGFDLVARLLELHKRVAWADVVITGEGKMDAQTLMGKGPLGVARMARAANKRIVAVCGRVEQHDELLAEFDDVVAVVDEHCTEEAALAAPAAMLQTRVAGSRKRLLVGV